MPAYDVNEVGAILTTTSNVGFLLHIRSVVNKRLALLGHKEPEVVTEAGTSAVVELGELEAGKLDKKAADVRAEAKEKLKQSIEAGVAALLREQLAAARQNDQQASQPTSDGVASPEVVKRPPQTVFTDRSLVVTQDMIADRKPKPVEVPVPNGVKLEPVGEEYDGTVVPLEELSGQKTDGPAESEEDRRELRHTLAK